MPAQLVFGIGTAGNIKGKLIVEFTNALFSAVEILEVQYHNSAAVGYITTMRPRLVQDPFFAGTLFIERNLRIRE